MAPKTIKMAILAALERLVDGNLEKFCSQLLEHKTKKIRESWVMGKSRVQVSDVLVQTYTEEGALKVVLQTLRDADFKQIAKQLEKDTRHLTKIKKQRKSKGGGASGAAASGHDLESVPNLPSVVNITDDGMNVTEPLRTTESHVFMNVSRLSLYGLWKKISQGFRSVTTQILVFLSPPNSRTKTQNLNLFLLPSNIPLDEVAAKRKSDQYIEVPVNCILIRGQSYSVRCPEAILIQPERQEFDMDFGPNYHPMFQVRLQTNTERVNLTLQDEENRTVWEHRVDLPGSGPTQSPEQKVELIREEFIDKLSDLRLRCLLDELLDKGVITYPEMKSTRTLSREDKARQVFDTVWKKGPAASSVLIAALCEVDPFLSRQLKLM